MEVNIVGLLVIFVFYLVILVVGVVITKRKKYRGDGSVMENLVVAGRDIGPVVGVFTMTATTVGGGYINGTAESIAKDGLVWTLAPFGIFIGLISGGLIFAKRMRERKYLTMLDPFQEQYGSLVVCLIYMASLCGDIFWTASILSALGTSLSVVVNLDLTVAIVTSASVTIIYTMIGQMIAVAYTDIFQLLFIIGGLALSVPFVLTNENVGDIRNTTDKWFGKLEPKFAGIWLDLLIAMTFGTIPWQAYFQRVLSVRSGRQAQILSIVGGCGALILVVPSVLIGAAGVSANWTNTSLGASPIKLGQETMLLPHVLKEFTPEAVSILGLGALCAAVMSSMDSSILGSSSMFTNNIYKEIIRRKAKETELIWIQRLAVFIVGSIATITSIFVPTLYGLFILAADIVFVIVLPQLICVVFIKFTNVYGSLTGYFMGLILRLGAGEYLLDLSPFWEYPFYDEEAGQMFPFRTFSMLCSLITIIVISLFTRKIFMNDIISKKYDILKAVSRTNQFDTANIGEEQNKHSSNYPKTNCGIEECVSLNEC